MRKIILLISTISILLLTGCGVDYEYIGNVNCEVIDKAYHSGYTIPNVITTVDVNGNLSTIITTTYIPDEFLTYVEYKELNLKKTIDDSKIYSTYEKGDYITMSLYKHPEEESYILKIIRE